MFIRNIPVRVAIITSTNIYNHTQHTILQSFITWQIVSTLKLEHQAMIQEQKLSAIRWRSLPFILKIHLKCN